MVPPAAAREAASAPRPEKVTSTTAAASTPTRIKAATFGNDVSRVNPLPFPRAREAGTPNPPSNSPN